MRDKFLFNNCKNRKKNITDKKSEKKINNFKKREN